MSKATNNQAKAFSIFQGLWIFNDKNLKNLIAIGDSSLIIKLMLKASPPSNGTLMRIITQIKREVARFENVEFYHVLRTLNHQANNLANKATLLERVKLRLKRGDIFFLFPKFCRTNLYDEPLHVKHLA